MRSYLLFLLGLSLFSVACQPKHNDSSPAPVNNSRYFEGELYQEFKNLNENNWAEDCDHNQYNAKSTMAADLDARKDEIAAASTQKQDLDNEFVKSFYLNGVEFLKIDDKKATDYLLKQDPSFQLNQWKTETKSWQALIDTYNSIKGTATDAKWVALNADVRGMIMDDERRIDSAANPTLDKDRGQFLKTLFDKVLVSTPDDLSTKLDQNDMAFMSAGKYETYILKNIEDHSISNRNDFITVLLQDIGRYMELYGFVPYEKAMLKDGILSVPMDLSAFGNDKDKFISIIENFWQSDSLKIKIVDAQGSDIFKVVLEKTAGGREFVDRQAHQMHLFPLAEDKVLVHEFGHVLGLPDEYYTLWDTKTCTYTYQFNYSNLMSVHEIGQIQNYHWDKIKKAYAK